MADLGSGVPGMGQSRGFRPDRWRARGVLPVAFGMLSQLLSALLFATTTGAAPPTAAPRSQVRATPVPTRTMVGSIVSVHPARGTVVVKESVRTVKSESPLPVETVTVLVGASTEVLVGKRAATIAELKPGDHVVVRYAGSGGSGLALSIRVAETAPPAAPAPAATPAPPAPASRG